MPSVDPGTGQVFVAVDGGRIRAAPCSSGCRRDFGQPEIQNLRLPALGDEDVGGLDVAMDDALGVGRIERVGNLDGQIEQVSISSGLPAIGASASSLPAIP